jgi:hypothetical protein
LESVVAYFRTVPAFSVRIDMAVFSRFSATGFQHPVPTVRVFSILYVIFENAEYYTVSASFLRSVVFAAK